MNRTLGPATTEWRNHFLADAALGRLVVVGGWWIARAVTREAEPSSERTAAYA